MMGNKIKIAKCPLRTKQTGHTLKSTQNTYVGSENLSQKKISTSDTMQAKPENGRLTFSPNTDFCKQYSEKDGLRVQKEISPRTSTIRKIINSTDTCPVGKQKPCKKHTTAETMNGGVVCLTQDQLRQILMLSVNQGDGSASLTGNREEEASQDSLHLINIPSEPKDVNVTGLLQKTEAASPVSSESEHVPGRAQEAFQKAAIENEWKPADIFSTLGERERDRSLLEARRAQWKKELDEQVALKKKEKEASQKWNDSWKPSEKFQVLDQSKEAGLLESPCSTMKQEQQRKWIEELNKQVEDDQQRKAEERMIYSKGEEHDRWAMHFDSLKSHPGSQSRLSSQLTHQHLESLCVSPDTQDLADVNGAYTPLPGVQVEPSEKEQRARPVIDMAVSHGQKTNFLRSMTALLDPAQIEERERRRQKQLEHQKAITAQVEENRRKKRLEEEQRKKEEQEEELRLAREREEMQRQYEEDILKQKQKEEIMTLKTNELFHTMQRAQELAQRLKQEQRIRELTQKGHDASRLIQNLGAQVKYKAPTTVSSSHGDTEEAAVETCIAAASTTSPKTDTGVQTDDVNLGIFNDVLPHCGSVTGSVTERGLRDFSSPEISTEFSGQIGIRKEKQELSMNKGTNLDKENSWYNDQYSQYRRTEKQTKLMKKCPKKPAWNINKPLKRYVPASAKYPAHLQKEKEEKKVRRQMELLHLMERNNPENLSQDRGTSPEILASSHRETESESRLHLIKKVEEPLKTPSVSKERFQTSPAVKSRTQQTQSNALNLLLKNSDYEKQTLTLGDGHTKLSEEMSEPFHFIPYVRTNEIYYLDPDAPLSRPSTQDNQYHKSHDCAQEQELFDSDHIRDPLLNPKLVKNRDRQQAILKGLSELRQGLLQKQKELETNLIPLTANQEDNFSSSF
ncbi:coiled-coil domain-containing protein 66 isoform X2 [Arvicanthis niloticus]|uniref:coiled-coil domain-containing protein 66 isoform X2 n=1 Tax=Arvicanthis niloticus TaxID=61156 RepID=UPI00402B40C8